MELADIAAITGMPGLYKISARRNDGLIVTQLPDGQTQFVSSRVHLFSTLDSITIYTTGEPVSLKEALVSIKAKEATNPLPDAKDDAKVKAWMETVLPTFDKEKVYVSDMKKLVKWYGILNSAKLVEELIAENAVEESTETEEGAEKKEGKKDAKKETKAKETKTKTAAKKSSVSNKGTSKPAPAAKKITTPRKAS